MTANRRRRALPFGDAGIELPVFADLASASSHRIGCFHFEFMDARVEAFYFIGGRLHELGHLVPTLIREIRTALPQFSRQKSTHRQTC